MITQPDIEKMFQHVEPSKTESSQQVFLRQEAERFATAGASPLMVRFPPQTWR